MEFAKRPTIVGIRELSDGTWYVVDSDTLTLKDDGLRYESIIIDTKEITLRLGSIELKVDNESLEQALRDADTIQINGITFKKEGNI